MKGFQSIDGFLFNVGKAYIALPTDIDRNQYLRDCYKNFHCSMRTEDGGFFNRVPVPPNILNFIRFPEKAEELGTCVIYNVDEQLQYPYVVGYFQDKEELGALQEHGFIFKRVNKTKYVQIDASAKSNVINVIVDSGDEEGEINIRTISKDSKSKVNIEVDGELNITTDNTATFTQYKAFKVTTQDQSDEKVKSGFEQTSTENKFYNQKFLINDGDDAMVLSSKLISLLSDLIEEISTSTTNTAIGLQPLTNGEKISKFKSRLDEIKSKEAFLKK